MELVNYLVLNYAPHHIYFGEGAMYKGQEQYLCKFEFIRNTKFYRDYYLFCRFTTIQGTKRCLYPFHIFNSLMSICLHDGVGCT